MPEPKLPPIHKSLSELATLVEGRLEGDAAYIIEGAAGLDVAIGAGSPLKRLTSAPRTVVSMLAASACAIVIFFVPAHRLWKPTAT